MGVWGAEARCPLDQKVSSFNFRHGYWWSLGGNNLVGLTAVKLYCEDGTLLFTEQTDTGDWKTQSADCNGGYTKAKALVHDLGVRPLIYVL